MVVVIQISMAKLFNLLNEDWLLPWSRMLNWWWDIAICIYACCFRHFSLYCYVVYLWLNMVTAISSHAAMQIHKGCRGIFRSVD
jgi:hypothetical protein